MFLALLQTQTSIHGRIALLQLHEDVLRQAQAQHLQELGLQGLCLMAAGGAAVAATVVAGVARASVGPTAGLATQLLTTDGAVGQGRR